MKDDLAALLAHETDDALPADHERRIREGLGALLAAAPTAPTPTEPSAAPAAPHAAGATAASVKLTTAVLVGLGLTGAGFAVGRATAPSTAPPTVTATPTTSAITAPTAAPSAAPSATTSAPAPSAPPTASAPPTPPAPGAPAATATGAPGFDREQSLLERARSALVRHDAAAAAAALDAHDAQFPVARHAEERDYLRIQLLRERGEVAAARERARAFLAAYPESLYRGRVESLAR